MKYPLIPLGDIAVVRGGSVNPEKFPDETFQLFSIPAYDENNAEILKGSEIGSSKKNVEPNDVLLSRIVPHIRRCWVVPDKNQFRQIASGEWILFRTNRFNPEFLKHFLVSDPFHSQFMKTVSGVGGSLLRARPAQVYQIKIPLPPLPEQKRIASILDAADALRTKRRQAIAMLDELLQATFLDMFGDPVTNPKGWDRKELGKVFKVKSGDGLTSKEMVTSGGYFVYGGNGINGSHDKYMFEDSKIILGRVGVYCGVVHLTKPRSWITDNALYISELFIEINQTYLLNALEWANLNQYAGQAAQPLISGNRIYPVEINLPPLTLQTQFAKMVEKVEAQKAVQQAHLAEVDTLFASLQQRAFAGAL